jgi:diguanylate cyclase (GGDEF)-like protein/PAS domain S-box-containing protein
MPHHSPRPEHLLAAILSSTEDAVVFFAPDGTIRTWTPGAERLYGYTKAEISGQPLRLLLPALEVSAHQNLLRATKDGTFARFEMAERVRKDGSTIQVALTRTSVRNRDGEVTGIVECARVAAETNTQAGDPEFQRLLEQMPAVLWTTDRSLRITSNWGLGLRRLKIKPGQLIGRTLYEYLKCEDPHAAPIAQHAEALRGAASQFEYRHGDRDFEIHLEPLRSASGEIIGCIGAGIDITERKRSEEQARYQATHDALTGLGNYRAFLDTLEQEVRRSERSNRSFAVLLLDLDDLKRINDRLGHLTGNRALKRLSEVMKRHCRSTDLAARYGGDEFAVILIDADSAMARQVAERVERAVRNDHEQPALTVSIGVALYPYDGRTAQELIEAADKHLYKRKKVHGAKA